MAALLPPGNIAAELGGLSRALSAVLGFGTILPFPCAAPLAWSALPFSPERLRTLAASARRFYGSWAARGGVLFLAPVEEENAAPVETGPESGGSAAGYGPADAPRPPFPAGLGFPLAWLPENFSSHILPAPPSLSFRTFEAASLRVSWGAGGDAFTWEILGRERYPLRIPRQP